ncbi:MAG: class I SAM-dependent methyltransferase [Brotaphodocola sp.]
MKHCIACGRELPEQPLFVLNHAPASAQDIPDAEEVKSDQGVTLNLCQCRHCGLVQFDCIPVSYYRDVIRASGFGATLVELRRSQYRHMIETYHLEGRKFLEVGCGRGEFLQPLREFPVEIYGVEHRQELVDIAVENGLSVWKDFPETEDHVFANGPFDVFLSFNFLEHQPHPDVMLKAIWNNLSAEGMGVVTVPALEYILEHGSYYELIRDHIAYYSFDTLRGLLERCGFEVLEQEMINRDTISMIVKKVSMREKQQASGNLPVNGISVEPMLKSYEILKDELSKLLNECYEEDKSLAIWGASHQGFTLASTMELGDKVSYIIDSAPFKQGRFAPASHLPIVKPDHFFEEPVDAILIVAPGYSREIAGIIRERFGTDVKVMTLMTNHIEVLWEPEQ